MPVKYSHHQEVAADRGDMLAITLLQDAIDTLPLRSLERDIVVGACLWLEGDHRPGGGVKLWWKEQDIADATGIPAKTGPRSLKEFACQ